MEAGSEVPPTLGRHLLLGLLWPHRRGSFPRRLSHAGGFLVTCIVALAANALVAYLVTRGKPADQVTQKKRGRKKEEQEEQEEEEVQGQAQAMTPSIEGIWFLGTCTGGLATG